MNKSKQLILTTALAALLTTGGLAVMSLASARAADAKTPADMKMSHDMPMPTTAADHNAEATKYDQEAASLDAKAAHHTTMAENYRGLVGGGSKQGSNFQSLANHCVRIAKAYRDAATEARALAESHRSMAKGG